LKSRQISGEPAKIDFAGLLSYNHHMMKISALWITKNEQETIGRSINSVAAVADELIVVDTGSTDDTVKISREMGASVLFFKWIDDFSAARNFALDQAKYDIVIFLDADEWFEPALNDENRDEILNILRGKYDGICCPMHNVDESGESYSIIRTTRIHNRRNNLRYRGRIHEALVREDRMFLHNAFSPRWIIKHSGYTYDVRETKLNRNIKILETLGDYSTTDMFYLMREYYYLNKHDEAYVYFDKMLHSKRKIAEFTENYSEISASFYFIGLHLASMYRSKVSRGEVYSNMAAQIQKLLPDYPGTPLIELLYAKLFRYDERKFLVLLSEYEANQKSGEVWDDFYRLALPLVYGAGAEAKLTRKEPETAMQYAMKAITGHRSGPKAKFVKIFTKALKTADETNIVLLLNKLHSLIGGDISDAFLENLMFEHFKTIYLYYFKKQYEAGAAKKVRFLYLMILNGDPKAAAEAALENRGELPEEDFNELFFYSVICADEFDFFVANKKYLGNFTDFAEAFFTGEPKTDLSEKNALAYIEMYRNIVFAAGREVGEKFLSVFAADPSLRLTIKAAYYFDGGLYEEFLSEEDNFDIRALSPVALTFILRCCLGAGRYDKALEVVKQLITKNQLTYEVINSLSVISEKGESGMTDEADRLYEEYSVALEEIIDIEDVINTGIVPDDLTKKEKRTLSVLTPSDFRKEIAGLKVLSFGPLLDKYMEVAEIYIEKGLYGMAEKYLRKLFACDYETEKTSSKLSLVYKELGNAKLSSEFL